MTETDWLHIERIIVIVGMFALAWSWGYGFYRMYKDN